MKKWLLSALLPVFACYLVGQASAAEFFVTSVVREVPMKSGEVAYKDFYINAGTNNGLRMGITIDAMRKLPVNDNINSKLLGDSTVRIARLKLDHGIEIDNGVCEIAAARCRHGASLNRGDIDVGGVRRDV